MQPPLTIGILGGMGPDATVRLFAEITQQTPAQHDAEHLPVVIYSLPQIPDRTAAIRKHGPSPVPAIVAGLRLLQYTPAAFAAIPCNTAFYFYPEFASQVTLPIIHLIKTVALAVAAKSSQPGVRVGILSTDGTRETGLYDHFLHEHELVATYPSTARQQALMASIYRIKAGERDAAAARAAGEELLDAGCEQIILACTEISLLRDDLEPLLPVIDSVRELASAAVRVATGQAAIDPFVLGSVTNPQRR